MNIPSFLVAVLLALTSLASVGAAAQTIDLDLVLEGLNAPRDLAHAGDARLFVALRDGRIVRIEGGVVAGVFLDIRDRVVTSSTEVGELGLLSLAFHPGFADNGFVFVVYTDATEDSVIARFRIRADDPNQLDPASERVLLRIAQPDVNHNVNNLRFGADGMLYVASGDGGFVSEPRCTGQQGDSLLGKILRLDVDQNVDAPPYHGIPADNPFFGPDTIRDEIWALGVRNPWRMSFDRLTGDLYIGDPGHNGGGAREEIDVELAMSGGGRNYGFKMVEGFRCRGSSAGCDSPLPPCDSLLYTPPVLDYAHTSERCAVVGGHVYRGDLIPSLRGVYLFGDFCGQLWTTSRASNWQLVAMAPLLPGAVTFGEDAGGELYVATLAGQLFRIVDVDLSEPNRGEVAFTQEIFSIREGVSAVTVSVTRVGGTDGAVSIRLLSTAGGTATEGDDYRAVDTVVSWADGEGGIQAVLVPIVDDVAIELSETFHVQLSDATGGVAVASPADAVVTIEDNDAPAACTPDARTLCLNEGRFQVQVDWRIGSGATGVGTAVPITTDGGWFWFFRDTNPEVFVKILDACDSRELFWVFAGGLTDVETRVTVVDTLRGVVKTYDSALGEPFGTIRDTRAFATCP